MICNDHGQKITFQQENINLLGCHLCQYRVKELVFSECKPLTSEKIFQDLNKLESDFEIIIKKNQNRKEII